MLPVQLLKSLEGNKGFDKEAFENIHVSGEKITSIRVNPFKFSDSPKLFSFGEGLSEVGWCQHGYYLQSRPSFTFDPLFHAGCYYVQEASSMFLEQAMKQTVDLSAPIKVLDLCAAPGGKSTHIHSLISKESLLVSNEVIRSRAAILKDNVIKWGCENVVVTNNDPKDFSKLENYFDVIVVDAPCSGSGLFRKEPDAIYEWSENNVQLCSQRQQRILADVLPSLKNGGILIYSTCSFSKEEDEQIVDWLQQECAMSYVRCAVRKEWGITDSESGYRFWPDKVKGEGFFLACLRKDTGKRQTGFKARKNVAPLANTEAGVIAKWVNKPGKAFVKNQSAVYVWPEAQVNDFNFLLEQLRVIYSGVLVGEMIRDKLVPDHALAMSLLSPGSIPRAALSMEEAIKYLQRKEFVLLNDIKGWCLATFEGNPLGWMNILTNRINNYYPKELRILRDTS